MAEDWARPVVVFEIRARDTERLRSFYADLFNWNIATNGPGGIARIEAGVGGPEPGPVGVIVPGGGGFAVYVQVLDLKTSMAKAEELGGSVIAQPFDVPGGPTIARIADPEGNQVGLVQQ